MLATMSSTLTDETSVPDSELIQAALLGQQWGYEGLTRRYQDRLFSSIRHEVGCPVLAEDIVQDAFVRAFTHLHSFRNQSNFYTWLYRIALNARRSYFRKSHRALPLDMVGDASEQMWSETRESPSNCAERVEERKQVREALTRLDEPHRTILILREFEGFDYQTIADVLHVKVGTVRSRLSRARAQLKRELAGYLGATPAPITDRDRFRDALRSATPCP